MASRRELTREVDCGPAGPKIAAFFDVDRTLPAGSFKGLASALRFATSQTSFPSFIEESSGDLVGKSEEELAELGERVFLERIATEIYPETRSLVEAHQRRGHTVAIVSSATHFQVDALARELGIEHVLCTELEFEDGRFTGKVARPACFGEGKAIAAQGLARHRDLDLAQSYFYTDSHDDLPLLDVIGHPRLVNPDGELA